MTPRIVTSGIGLTLVVDVVGAVEAGEVALLEAVLPVAAAKTDTELKLLIVPSR
jgi:hypothetical protein